MHVLTVADAITVGNELDVDGYVSRCLASQILSISLLVIANRHHHSMEPNHFVCASYEMHGYICSRRRQSPE